jgi:hypothetical protein
MSPTDTQAIAAQAQTLTLSELYEVDDYLWLEETIKLLKAGNFSALDLENLIEELEDLGKSQRWQAESFLEQIIRHLLMLQYWTQETERNSNHWRAEIINFRKQLNRRLTTTLKNHLRQELNTLYQDAVDYLIVKSNSQMTNLPENCPYSLEQLLDANYL